MNSPQWPQPFPRDPAEEIPPREKERLDEELFLMIDDGAFDLEQEELEL